MTPAEAAKVLDRLIAADVLHEDADTALTMAAEALRRWEDAMACADHAEGDVIDCCYDAARRILAPLTERQ